MGSVEKDSWDLEQDRFIEKYTEIIISEGKEPTMEEIELKFKLESEAVNKLYTDYMANGVIDEDDYEAKEMEFKLSGNASEAEIRYLTYSTGRLIRDLYRERRAARQ